MAVERVDLMARVDGYLSEIRFKPGQIVAKGDILFVIDRRPYQALLDNSKATGSSRSGVARLTKDHERMQRLVNSAPGPLKSSIRSPATSPRRGPRCWPPRLASPRSRSTSISPK